MAGGQCGIDLDLDALHHTGDDVDSEFDSINDSSDIDEGEEPNEIN